MILPVRVILTSPMHHKMQFEANERIKADKASKASQTAQTLQVASKSKGRG